MKRYGLNDLPQNSFYRELFKHCTYALDMPGNWMALGIRFEIRLLISYSSFESCQVYYSQILFSPFFREPRW